MATPSTITSEIQKLAPSAVIELFEVDATSIGGDILRFHGGTNGLQTRVVWQGNAYEPFPVQITGFEYTGTGTLPRPRLQVANLSGIVTALVLMFDDMLGAKVSRKRTFAKYLDQENFPDLYSYTFDSGTDGWAASTATLTASNGSLIWTPTGTNPTLYRSLSLSERYQGSAARWITARVRRVSGTGTWEGNCYYWTPSHGASASYRKAVSAPSDLDQWNTVVWDMSALTAGGNDYITSEIQYIRFDLVSDATSVWEISDIKVTGTNPTADATAEFPDDVYFIDRKSSETVDAVEFELAASFDLQGVMLPRRQIVQNVCTWQYRGTECGYTGTNYYNANDQPTTAANDFCSKRLSSCKIRFGQYQPLPFGGFPAAGLVR